MITIRYEFLLISLGLMCVLGLILIQEDEIDELRVEVMKARGAADFAIRQANASKETEA